MHRTEIMPKASELHIERLFELYPRLQSTQSIQLHCELLLLFCRTIFNCRRSLFYRQGSPYLKAVFPIEPLQLLLLPLSSHLLCWQHTGAVCLGSGCHQRCGSVLCKVTGTASEVRKGSLLPLFITR